MQPTRRSRRLVAKSAQHPVEEVDLDSSLSFPHIPNSMGFTTQDENWTANSTDEDKYAGETMEKSPGLKGDRASVALLTFLYVLQGIPLGLAGSIPYLLQSRKVNYKDQAIFSFVYWPFSLKLFWAPIVDSVYFPAFGRRKSWLVPIQYLIGCFMFGLSGHVDEMLGDGDTAGPVNVKFLTAVFFSLNFLAATQDIAVDGWALTMLSRKNVGWASTCNTVGQTAGYFMGNIVFLALESPDFCNTYLRSEPSSVGVITLAGFFYFWGVVFLITTTLVMVLKRESTKADPSLSDQKGDSEQGIIDTYMLLLKIVRLPAVMTLIGILLTMKMGFAAADSATGLKLIEAGVPKEKLALIGVPLVPIQILLPILIGKYTAGPRPMDILLKAMPYRLIMGMVFAAVVWWTPQTQLPDGTFPLHLYITIIVVYAIHQVTLYSMFVSLMGFFARVSDPAIGGTYMTLLNTISNFGGNWPSTVALWLVDNLTWMTCMGADGECPTEGEQKSSCELNGGQCHTTIDGYYVESVLCLIIGVVWLTVMAKTVRKLQDCPQSDWSCFPTRYVQAS